MKKGIVGVTMALAGAGMGAMATGKALEKKVDKWQQMSDKHLALFMMMNRWVKVKQEGKNLSEYFEKNSYKNIAVYGMSFAGETLMDELKDSGICVKYGIDKKAGRISKEIDMVTMEDDLPEVDAVVVTAITFFDEIAEGLENKLNCPILSLEYILYEV